MSLGVFIFSLILYFFVHSALAASSVKNRLYTIVPPIYYRIFYNLIAIGLLLFLVWVYSKVAEALLFKPKFIFQMLGGSLFVLGMLFGYKSLQLYDLGKFIGTKNSSTKLLENKQKLQTEGLNGIVRHPLYFATLLLVWGFFLILPSTKILAIAVMTTFYIPIGIYFEEKKLLLEYGQDYVNYQKRVPKILPFLF